MKAVPFGAAFFSNIILQIFYLYKFHQLKNETAAS